MIHNYLHYYHYHFWVSVVILNPIFRIHSQDKED